MRYRCKPNTVEAYSIVSVGRVDNYGNLRCALENGENVVADAPMLARYVPIAGDYWVIQPDGYVYVNPKAVFERKYERDAD